MLLSVLSVLFRLDWLSWPRSSGRRSLYRLVDGLLSVKSLAVLTPLSVALASSPEVFLRFARTPLFESAATIEIFSSEDAELFPMLFAETSCSTEAFDPVVLLLRLLFVEWAKLDTLVSEYTPLSFDGDITTCR